MSVMKRTLIMMMMMIAIDAVQGGACARTESQRLCIRSFATLDSQTLSIPSKYVSRRAWNFDRSYHNIEQVAKKADAEKADADKAAAERAAQQKVRPAKVLVP